MVGTFIKDKNENFFLNKKFEFKNFLDSQNFINTKLEKSQKMKGITQIYLLAGVMQK
jgi:hypothetical protein